MGFGTSHRSRRRASSATTRAPALRTTGPHASGAATRPMQVKALLHLCSELDCGSAKGTSRGTPPPQFQRQFAMRLAVAAHSSPAPHRLLEHPRQPVRPVGGAHRGLLVRSRAGWRACLHCHSNSSMLTPPGPRGCRLSAGLDSELRFEICAQTSSRPEAISPDVLLFGGGGADGGAGGCDPHGVAAVNACREAAANRSATGDGFSGAAGAQPAAEPAAAGGAAGSLAQNCQAELVEIAGSDLEEVCCSGTSCHGGYPQQCSEDCAMLWTGYSVRCSAYVQVLSNGLAAALHAESPALHSCHGESLLQLQSSPRRRCRRACSRSSRTSPTSASRPSTGSSTAARPTSTSASSSTSRWRAAATPV